MGDIRATPLIPQLTRRFSGTLGQTHTEISTCKPSGKVYNILYPLVARCLLPEARQRLTNASTKDQKLRFGATLQSTASEFTLLATIIKHVYSNARAG